MQNKEQDLLAKKISEQLDDAVTDMDGQTQSRLRQIRAGAIDQAINKGARPFYSPRWLSAGIALASVIMLTVLLMPLQPEHIDNNQGNLPATLAAEDLDILTEQEDLELYEDLEFYRWMSTSEMG